MEIVNAILLALFGGVNILQFIYYKIQRDKMRAEAKRAIEYVKENQIGPAWKDL